MVNELSPASAMTPLTVIFEFLEQFELHCFSIESKSRGLVTRRYSVREHKHYISYSVDYEVEFTTSSASESRNDHRGHDAKNDNHDNHFQ